MSNPVVFISYSHDSDAHSHRVAQLSERLRLEGFEARIDQYVNGDPEQGWPRWMLDQLDEADAVLVVCTETYYQRFRGRQPGPSGKGVDWEGAIITNELYDAKSRSNRFIPIMFDTADVRSIPEPLRGRTFYKLTSDAEHDLLLDRLSGSAGIEPARVGERAPRERQTVEPLVFESESAPKVDVARVERYAADFLGRDDELALLDDAWKLAVEGEAERPMVLTFVAMGGEGKTSLVAEWLVRQNARGWPGCEAAFAWSFYSQGTRDQVAATSDLFLAEALRFFGDPKVAASATGVWEKGRRLAELVSSRRALLVLDGLEPLQAPPGPPDDGKLQDGGIIALLRGLASRNNGLCVVTTRHSITDLARYRERCAPEVELSRLPAATGVALLRSLSVNGPDAELALLVEEVRGHALTLNLVGAYLRDAHYGDIARTDHIDLAAANATRGGHAFRVMDSYVRWLERTDGPGGRQAVAMVRLVGLFDRPITADCLNALLGPPALTGLTDSLVGLDLTARNIAINRLQRALLINVKVEGSQVESIDAHPLVRDYFAHQLRNRIELGLGAPLVSPWRAGHQRLFQHLVASTEEGSAPSLHDLQPLYQAVLHGCRAGLHKQAFDVFYRRICRESEAYTTRTLGAFGPDLAALACFFDATWAKVTSRLSPVARSWIASSAAYGLWALGRFRDAGTLYEATVPAYVAALDPINASIQAGNLSELRTAAGDLSGALRAAETAIDQAEQSRDPLRRLIAYSFRGTARHQQGDDRGARADFDIAETLQAAHTPAYPRLNSLRGFQYCELLLGRAESAVWHSQLHPDHPSDPINSQDYADAIDRAETTRRIAASEGWLSDLSLATLTITRAALYQRLLARQTLDPATVANSKLTVQLFREASYQDYLTRGLLTRSWVHALTGDLEAARGDLDEAKDIAERGPMLLHQTDVLLYRARLFGPLHYAGTHPYPWPGDPLDDVRHAAQLITQTGYYRRQSEVDDALASLAPRAAR